MTCLTLTPDVAEESIQGRAQLIVSHHPILFNAVQRVTGDNTEGRMLWRLAQAGIAVYSPHTAWDNAPDGINQLLARSLGLTNIQALRPFNVDETAVTSAGAGRFGRLPTALSLSDLAGRVAKTFGTGGIDFVGASDAVIEVLGIACGSAAEFWNEARRRGCDALLTGETRFHGALEVRAAGFPVLLAGHYVTERPGMEHLAMLLSQTFPSLDVWCSRVECDPLQRS